MMKQVNCKDVFVALMLATALATASTAEAQSAAPATSPWSAEVGIGLDNSISGNINSSGIGKINNQVVVITKNRYEDVYGTGLHLRFGAGYRLNDKVEATATLTFQNLGADLTRMGDIGVSNLYGQYDDYQSLSLDFGLRRYRTMSPTVRAYIEGAIGIAFVDATNVILVAPQANLSGTATDFYDRTAAYTLGANAGVAVKTGTSVETFGQWGFRRVSGMSAVDGLAGTGLEKINDNSARWTLPFVVGARLRF